MNTACGYGRISATGISPMHSAPTRRFTSRIRLYRLMWQGTRVRPDGYRPRIFAGTVRSMCSPRPPMAPVVGGEGQVRRPAEDVGPYERPPKILPFPVGRGPCAPPQQPASFRCPPGYSKNQEAKRK